MSDVKPVAYKFQESKSIMQVKDYLLKCIAENVAFDGSNIPHAVLDAALIQVSKDFKTPIITLDESAAQVLAITYKYKKFYSKDKIPSSVGNAICYQGVEPSMLPKNLTTLLVIVGDSTNE